MATTVENFLDYEVCRSALGNPDKRVVKLALQILRDSAAAGDPFAAEILEEIKSGKGDSSA